MKIRAELNYLRISPRKVRLVADLVRGKQGLEAKRILSFTNKGAAKSLLKLLNSAIANAKDNFQLVPEDLQISGLLVNEGPKLKRWRPRARGQAYEIQKKTSHIIITLREIDKERKKIPKKILKDKKTEQPKVKEVKEEKKITKVRPGEKKERIVGARKPLAQRGIKRIFRRKAF